MINNELILCRKETYISALACPGRLIDKRRESVLLHQRIEASVACVLFCTLPKKRISASGLADGLPLSLNLSLSNLCGELILNKNEPKVKNYRKLILICLR